MASSKEFVQYICDQMSATRSRYIQIHVWGIRSVCRRKIFCYNLRQSAFFKPTEAGRAAFSLPECSPYEGAKPYLLLENPEKAGLVSHVARVTLDALPLHPKKAKKKDG